MRADFSDKNYYGKSKVESELYFLKKGKRISQLIEELGLNPNCFRAKELNTKNGTEENSCEFLGPSIYSLPFINVVGTGIEKLEIEVFDSYEYEVNGSKKRSRNYWNIPNVDNSWEKGKVPHEIITRKQTVDIYFTNYQIDFEALADIKNFAIEYIKAL